MTTRRGRSTRTSATRSDRFVLGNIARCALAGAVLATSAACEPVPIGSSGSGGARSPNNGAAAAGDVVSAAAGGVGTGGRSNAGEAPSPSAGGTTAASSGGATATAGGDAAGSASASGGSGAGTAPLAGGAEGSVGTGGIAGLPATGAAAGSAGERASAGAPPDGAAGSAASSNTGGGEDVAAGRGGLGANGAAGASGAGGAPPEPCLYGTLEIRGRITSPRGEPTVGVIVSLSGGVTATVSTDPEGRYAFGGLCPGRDYRVTPSAPSLGFCRESAALVALRHDVVEDFTSSASGCEIPVHQPRVLVLVFDPYVFDPTESGATSERLSVARDWFDPPTLASGLERALTSITNGRVRPRIVETRTLATFPLKVGGVQYSESEYLACVDRGIGCITADTADYATLLQSQALCHSARNGEVDEVWMFGGPYFGFWEAELVGRPAFVWPVEPIEDATCPRLVPVSGFNYARELDAALLTVMRRVELTMTAAYGGWQQNRMETAFDQFGLVASASPDLGFSGCGSSDYAPNGVEPWTFDNPAPVASHCDTFFDYPALGDLAGARRDVTCTDWGCDSVGYSRYWLGHLPRGSGVAPDGKLADWWRYLLSPQDLAPIQPVRCAASTDPAVCGAATDGDPTSCLDVSAEPNGALGWIELDWESPRPVSSVALYTGGCPGQILDGHLAFSDGSDPLPFSALADEGATPTVVSFPTKDLTWLRVVNGSSAGTPNTAIGEIVLEP